MDTITRVERLYLFNATLLISHEIDAAYWHEWQLFHLPGGIQLFVLLHLLLLPLVLAGYREIIRRGRYAKQASLGLAAVGIFAALLHGTLILAGDRSFSLPVSQLLLVATFAVSLYQLVFTLRTRKTA